MQKPESKLSGFGATASLSLIAIGVLLLPGCLRVLNHPIPEPTTGAQIYSHEGRFCRDNRCFTYRADTNEIAIMGRNPVLVPAGVNLRDGSVSDRDFEVLFTTAKEAHFVEKTGGWRY